MKPLATFFLLIFFLTPFSVISQNKDGYDLFKKRPDKIKISTYEIKIRLTNFSYQAFSFIESEMDYIIENAKEDSIVHNAFIIKINWIPALQKAIYNTDPLTSAIDGLVFCHQVHMFFESGEGSNLFGPYQGRIIQTSKIIVDELKHILRKVNPEGNIDNGNRFVREWALENPIMNYYFTRNSATDLLAKWLGTEKKKLVPSVLSTTEEIRDLSSRMTVYTEYMPKQIEWQSELKIRQLNKYFDFGSKMDRMDNLVMKIDSLDPMGMVDSISITMFDEIDRQRRSTLHFMANERVNMMNDLSVEREAVFRDIAKEREMLTDFLSHEKHETLTMMDGMIRKTYDKAYNDTNKLINQILNKLLIAITIFSLGIIVATILYKKL